MKIIGRGRIFGRGPGAAPAPVTAPPVFTVAPAIASDDAYVGTVATVTPGTVTGAPTPTVTRQWYRDAEAILGETGLTYAFAAADVGKTVTCLERAENTQGVATSTSNGILVSAAPEAGLGVWADIWQDIWADGVWA